MQQLVKEKVHNLKAIAIANNANNLVLQLTEAEKRTFPSIEAVQEWFKSVLKQQKNYDLTTKWMNVFERMQVYRDAWREIKNGNEADMLDIYKVLSAAESKLTLTVKDEIVELTTKMTIGISKEPKIKEYREVYKEKVQELAQTRKDRDKSKTPPKPIANIVRQQRPESQTSIPKAPQPERSSDKSPSVPLQRKVEKPPSEPQQRNQTPHVTFKQDKPPAPKPVREQKKQEPIRVAEPRKQFPSFAQIKIQKPSPAQPPSGASYAPLKPRSIMNPHDQIKCIENKLSTNGFLASDKNVLALIKKQLNSHMKSVLVKLIKLSGLSNPLGNQDEFTYFSKKNDQNPTHFPNSQVSLHERVPRKDRFFKITYPHKLKIFCQLRIEQERQEEKLRVDDKRKRKEAEKEVFEFVRGEQKPSKTYEFKEENTKLQKVMIKLPVVQTMMELDPFYSKSRILHMSYYL